MISPKQKKILAFPYSEYTALICDGAVRSGKTSLMMVAFIDWAMRGFNRQRFGICGKTVDSATKNIIVPYLSSAYPQSQRGYTLRWRRSDKLLEVSRGPVTNYFEVFGGKDESSFTLIQGRTLAGVLLDEVVLMPRSFVEQALTRCSVSGAKLWFSCNPGAPGHWFYQEWIKNHAAHNALYLHFEMRDNPSLSAETLARYDSMFSGVFHDRYVKGLWVAAEGLVYRLFAENPERYLIDDAGEYLARTEQTVAAVMIGVDFGGNKSATAFKAVLITQGYREVVVAAERHMTGDVDPDALNRAFSDFVRTVTDRWGKAAARADSAEQILIRGLYGTAQRERLAITVKNAMKQPIIDRIRLVAMLLAQDRLKVCRGCTHMAEALRDARYDDKHEDERLDDGTSDIDSLDAFEYALEPHFDRLERAGIR